MYPTYRTVCSQNMNGTNEKGGLKIIIDKEVQNSFNRNTYFINKEDFL